MNFSTLICARGTRRISGLDWLFPVLSLMDFNYEWKHAQQFSCTYCFCDIVNCLYFKIIISVCHSTNIIELLFCVQENVKHEMRSKIKSNMVPTFNEKFLYQKEGMT